MKTSSTSKLTVFISDSFEITLSGLVSIVNEYSGVHEICSAKNRSEMRTLYRNVFFDLFLIDIDMIGIDTISFIRLALTKNKNAKVVLLSNVDDVLMIRKYFKEGATGYLNKRTSKKEMHSALKVVLNGGYYLDAQLRDSVLLELLEVDHEHCLTSFDLDVLYLIAHEYSNKEIAKFMATGEKTIEYHRMNLFKSLGIKNMAGAGAYAVLNGIFFNPTLNNKFGNMIRNDHKIMID